MTPRIVAGDLAELQLTFANEFERQAAEVTARREKFIVALCGGSVAAAFFPMLPSLAVNWTHVEVFWVDERAVPPNHPDSNFGLASRLLLAPARIPAARIHRMQGELPDLDQAARRATDELRAVAGDPPRLDLAIVGVGEDGHVASIFPNRALRAVETADTRPTITEPPVVAVYDSPKPPARRLTLTLSVLANASVVIVGAFGAAKAQALRGALSESGSATPVAELLRRASAPLVLLDREAAGLS